MRPSILFGGYRPWAMKVFDYCKSNFKDFSWYHAKDPTELEDLVNVKSVELVILAGWSWIIPEKIIDKNTFVGFHPSDLPDYAGGSPIQNQILDGLTKTKMSLYKLDEKIDHGGIIYKEDLSLEGDITEIFDNISASCISLIERLFVDYPELRAEPQEGTGKKCKRLQPSQSRIEKNSIANFSSIDLYNFIRCRQDPYPNAFIEDEFGTIYFKKVEFRKGDTHD